MFGRTEFYQHARQRGVRGTMRGVRGKKRTMRVLAASHASHDCESASESHSY